MTDHPAEWFANQLRAATDGFVWAIRQVPAERLDAKPPSRLGEWSATRQAFHALYYDREVALPSMEHWLGEPYPTFEGYDEAAAWANAPTLDEVLAELEQVRSRQIAVLAKVTESQWEEVRHTSWGDKSFYWVISKTYAHTVEHLDNVLRIALLWDHYAAREHKQETDAAGKPEL
jgi:hypothetical protein